MICIVPLSGFAQQVYLSQQFTASPTTHTHTQNIKHKSSTLTFFSGKNDRSPVIYLYNWHAYTVFNITWHLSILHGCLRSLQLSRCHWSACTVCLSRAPASLFWGQGRLVRLIWSFQIRAEFTCKHCQRHNGPESWVHITSSQFKVHKSWSNYNFRISIKH